MDPWPRRSGALSNTFSLQAGHTYWVKFWIAPDEATNLEPFTVSISEGDTWTRVPNDQVREFQYFYTPETDEPGQLEVAGYPDFPDRCWLDDVVVQEVTATPYRNAAIVRFDEPLPTDARSILVYNDTRSRLTSTSGVGATSIPRALPWAIRSRCGASPAPCSFRRRGPRVRSRPNDRGERRSERDWPAIPRVRSLDLRRALAPAPPRGPRAGRAW